MNDEQIIDRLRTAMAEETRGHRLDADAAASTALASRPGAGGPRRRTRVAVAAGLVGAAAVAGIYAAAAARHGDERPAAPAGCGPVQHGALPRWARAGFTPPDQNVPHIVSARGTIIAVLFVDLRVHQASNTNNKILWTARDGGGTGPLVIRATLPRAGASATRTVDNGPGPSIIDLPAPGCWHLDLTWGTHHDTIDIPYAP